MKPVVNKSHNSRQRRKARAEQAKRLEAISTAPSMVALDGYIRSSVSSVTSLKGRTHMGFHASFHSASAPLGTKVTKTRKGGRKLASAKRSRFTLDGFK